MQCLFRRGCGNRVLMEIRTGDGGRQSCKETGRDIHPGYAQRQDSVWRPPMTIMVAARLGVGRYRGSFAVRRLYVCELGVWTCCRREVDTVDGLTGRG